ncbi:MAG TPA: hypothetical protein PK239_03170 [Chitinophagales bacterium]|nr:hypothetical protein [Chitinophagales bacterium]HRK26271.1 hypothetical protein [Chitinophagales bacterium]
MESLQYLLNHPCVVVSKVSAQLYEYYTPAGYSRLRSRASGRHRFQEQEAQALIKLFAKIATQVGKLAAKFEKAANADKSKKEISPLLILHHDMLNMKPLLSKAAQKNNSSYYKLYDVLRSKSTQSDEAIAAVIEELNLFAAEISQKVEQAKTEAKTYPFGYGRGSKSHILA